MIWRKHYKFPSENLRTTSLNKKSKLKNDNLGRLWDGCRFTTAYERIERIELDDDEERDVME
jgi:hypothetical protein